MSITLNNKIQQLPKHLIFVQHGMFGTSYFFDNFKKKLEAAFIGSHVSLPHKNNFIYSTLGTKVCGDKLVAVVEDELLKHPDASTISFIGHSFGGIMSRYAIGILESRNIFDQIKPLAYVSISTPHAGVITNKSIIKFGLHNCTGTTGQELIREVPVLEELSKPNSVFVKGLEKFPLKLLYGNLHNDDVTAPTACLYNTQCTRELIEVVPKRLFIVREHDDVHDDVFNRETKFDNNLDPFEHIKKMNWTRKVADLSEYSNSHITIVGRHTYIPFLKIKSEEASVVLMDIILEMTRHIIRN